MPEITPEEVISRYECWWSRIPERMVVGLVNADAIVKRLGEHGFTVRPDGDEVARLRAEIRRLEATAHALDNEVCRAITELERDRGEGPPRSRAALIALRLRRALEASRGGS